MMVWCKAIQSPHATVLYVYYNNNTVDSYESRQAEAVYFSRERCTACREYEHVGNNISLYLNYLNYKPDWIGEYIFALQCNFQSEHPKTMHEVHTKNNAYAL